MRHYTSIEQLPLYTNANAALQALVREDMADWLANGDTSAEEYLWDLHLWSLRGEDAAAWLEANSYCVSQHAIDAAQ